ncbi:hypothetical protein B0T17DRAFT_506186 [Bombardia bombarda]|uniref:RNA polymerase II subunit B1 CTD phosphatase RPAP2 homolog n=1 Tax=Bombardia bombarda TaxID=252184 RepID=A0AA39X9A1_9PEZI|nr:hypothetical protein B0T17DRAFT_506186 [Bombardia bombarda]
MSSSGSSKPPLRGILKHTETKDTFDPNNPFAYYAPPTFTGAATAAATNLPQPPQPQEPPREDLARKQAVLQAKLMLERGEIKPPFPSKSLSASANAREFIDAVEDFFPGEYLDLIEERNCLGKCGYTLCPRPRRNYVGEFKIMKMGIAEVAEVNKWCSNKCAARGLYIKVQLDNPSFKRKNGQWAAKVELLNETTTTTTTATPAQKQQSRSGKDTSTAGQDIDMEAQNLLAAERGDAGKNTTLGGKTVEATIREKSLTTPAQAPDHRQLADEDPDVHLVLEGHKTTFGTGKSSTKKNAGSDDSGSEDDDDDSDGDLLDTIRF